MVKLVIIFYLGYLTESIKNIHMKNENIVFEGRLLEIPSEAPRCGDEKVAVGYKFKVEKLIRGEGVKNNVIVLVPCPDLKGNAFIQVKAIYRIEVTANLEDSTGYTIYNDYSKEKKIWWSVNIEKIKPAN